MFNDLMYELLTETRRGTLVKLHKLLESKEDLRSIAGKSTLVDCALYLVAKDDEALLNNLKSVIPTDELLDDVKHVNESFKLKDLRKTQLGG